MREIKFRGVFFNHHDNSFSHFQFWGLNYLGNGSHQWLGSNSNAYHKESNQYTGLKDKNNIGEDLYEGDVVYLAGYGNYICEFPFIQLYEALHNGDIGHKIGNIYENPELL